jgi:hypothetical protein
MKQLRNIAVSGVTTQEQYSNVVKICGDMEGAFAFDPNSPIIYDGIRTNLFMYNWSTQNYKHCTLYTYEDFIAKFDKKETPMSELVLQEPVVFNTLEELQEAINLGLMYKDFYLDGRYSLPMLQSIQHNEHIPLSDISDTLDVNYVLNITAGQKALDWKDVRHKYIKPKTKVTLAQIEEALGYKIELI